MPPNIDAIATRRPKRKCTDDKVPDYREDKMPDCRELKDDYRDTSIPLYKKPHMPAGSKVLVKEICKFIHRGIPESHCVLDDKEHCDEE